MYGRTPCGRRGSVAAPSGRVARHALASRGRGGAWSPLTTPEDPGPCRAGHPGRAGGVRRHVPCRCRTGRCTDGVGPGRRARRPSPGATSEPALCGGKWNTSPTPRATASLAANASGHVTVGGGRRLGPSRWRPPRQRRPGRTTADAARVPRPASCRHHRERPWTWPGLAEKSTYAITVFCQPMPHASGLGSAGRVPPRPRRAPAHRAVARCLTRVGEAGSASLPMRRSAVGNRAGRDAALRTRPS